MPFQKGHPQYSTYTFPKGNIPWNKGIKTGSLSLEHKSKISSSNKGKNTWSKGNPTWIKGTSRPEISGANNPEWKGDSVGYRALHHWVDRTLGSPQHCSICNDTSNHRYHWANVSGEYLRITADWIRLCPKCHGEFDAEKRTIEGRERL